MRTLAEFLAELDQQKDESVGERPDAWSMGDLQALGARHMETAHRQAERTGCSMEELTEAALRRTVTSTAASIQLVVGGVPMAKAIQQFQGSCWVDGFLAGVLWEQARALETQMGGE